MFDPVLNRYEFTCPKKQETVHVRVSSFRMIRRLRGAEHPAVFRVQYDCKCGDAHEALVPHDTLDWAPLGTENTETYLDLITGRRELLAAEFIDQAATKIRSGKWPWLFWCHPESTLRPGFPSGLRFVTPEHDHGQGRIGTLVRCANCSRHTVNIVSRDHLDVPWHNDSVISYVAQVFDNEKLSAEERFRQQLWNGQAAHIERYAS